MEKFSNLWWDNFLETTGDMKKTAVMNDSISLLDIGLMKQLIKEIIYDLSQLRTVEFGYRVFVNNHKLDENEMNQIYDLPPLNDESIEEWCSRVFKKQEFGIIINSAERFNNELSNLLAIKSKPLLDKLGFPIEGVNFTLFIGNYSNTPIGIHQDMPGENVIHYHLGPGKKTMYTWEEKKFEKLEKIYNNKNIDKLIEFADEYTFDKGDLYFMPQGLYHVGKQESLSIALTFWFYNHSKKRILEKLQTIIFEQFINEKDELISPDNNAIDDLSKIEEITSVLNLPADTDKLSYKELLKEAYQDLKYSIASNAGYRTSLIPRLHNFTIKLNDNIIIEKPYKILYTESHNKNKLYIYLRGIKISFNNVIGVVKIINLLNKGNMLEVKKINELIDENWDFQTLKYFLSLLYKHYAIKKV